MSGVIFLDDNANFVRSVFDSIRSYIDEVDSSLPLEAVSNLTQLDQYIERNEEEPKLAILDLWLVDAEGKHNKKGGVEALRKLRDAWPSVYCLFLSGHLGEDNSAEFDDLENLALAPKDTPPETLKAAITEILKS